MECERRHLFALARVVGDVATGAEEHPVGDAIGRPEMFDHEVEERAASRAHPRLLGLHQAVGPKPNREGREAVEEGADLVEAARRAVVADGPFEAGRARQGELRLRRHQAGHFDRIFDGAASGSTSRMTELHEDGERSRHPVHPLREQLNAGRRIHGAEDLEAGVAQLRRGSIFTPGGSVTSLAISTRRTPAASITRACATVAALMPHAPASSWRRQSWGAIVVFPCGASSTPWFAQ